MGNRQFSCSLIERITSLAIEVVKILGLDEVETSGRHAREQRNNLRMGNLSVFCFSQEAAALMIRTERLGVPARPSLDAAIAHHLEFYALAIQLTERVA